MRASRRIVVDDGWRGARRCCVGLALASSLVGCGGSSDPQQTIQSLRSWSGTLELVRAERRSHRVGDAYARQLLDAAREAQRDVRQSLASRQLPDSDRGRVDAAMARLDGDRRLLTSELHQR